MNKVKLNLLAKILLCVTLPILILVIFAVASLRSTGNLMAERMLEQRLAISDHALKEMFGLTSKEDFHLEGVDLYLGSLNLTAERGSLQLLSTKGTTYANSL